MRTLAVMPNVGWKKWLELAQYRKTAAFLGPKVTGLLFLGVLTGLLLFAVEVAFAYGLQAFLLAIGVMSPDVLHIPSWVPASGLGQVLFYLLAAGTLRGALQWAQLYTQGATSEEMTLQQRSRLVHWAFHSESASSSEVTSLFGEKVNRSAAAMLNLQSLTVQLTSAALLGLSLLIMVPLLTIATACALAVLALLLRRMDSRISSASQGAMDAWDRTNRRVLMSIKNLLLMQIYGTQGDEEAAAQVALREYTAHAYVYYRNSALKFTSTQVLGVGLICFVTLSAKSSGTLAPGMLVTYFYLLVRFLQTFAALNLSYSALLQNWHPLKQLAKWWANKSFDGVNNTRQLKAALRQLPAFTQPIGWDLQQVSFSYPDDPRPVIEGMNLSIEPGKVLVISGPSGAGKSTLLGLMLGGLHPSLGKVEIESAGKKMDLEEVRDQLLKSIGYVGAESFLVEGTVRENITYGLRTSPSDQEVEEALRQAECQFVFSLPKGLEHFLTEQGQGLSAGQKQRLSLARALIRKPRALILDEATANLDVDTESRLLDTLATLRNQMTIVAVTHRPSLLRISDQRLSLGQG